MEWADEFRGKKVVITGAAGLYGGRFATAFAARGAVLCLADLRRPLLDGVVRRLGLDARATLLHGTDLTCVDSIRDLAALVGEAWGAPDIVINNAGIYPRTGPLIDLDEREWDRMFAINVRAPFIVTREMAKLMVARGVQGAVVNIGSGKSRQVAAGLIPYCTTKAALERLSKGFALELAQHRIRVNVVDPPFAAGSDSSPMPDDYIVHMMARIPLGASGPDDAANAVLYLCSRAANYITGAVLTVDGGNSIGAWQPPGSAN